MRWMAAAALVAVSTISWAVRLHPLFTDDMVLQRGVPVRVWGWASPGSKVHVAFLDAKVEAVAGPDGDWQVWLPAMQPGRTGVLTASSPRNSVTLRNVITGDVWVCSGQSNMEWTVLNSANPQEEIATANHPLIRHIDIPNVSRETPQAAFSGARWTVSSPATAAHYTAVGYYFAREVHRRTGVPIGLINTTWGGTPVESWTPRPWLSLHPVLADRLQRQVAATPRGVPLALARSRYREALRAWASQSFPLFVQTDSAQELSARSGWVPLRAIGSWETEAGLDVDGIVAMRASFNLDSLPAAGSSVVLELGAVDDADLTFVNGELIGRGGIVEGDAYDAVRRYPVRRDLLRQGRNEVLVKSLDTGGGGGFLPAAQAPTLVGGGLRVSLSRWELLPLDTSPSNTRDWRVGMPQPPVEAGNPYSMGSLYNGMVHPLLPFRVKGFLWYQGESNAGEPALYAESFPLMIRSWRSLWGQGDLPFYFVQLASWGPGGPSWAELREAQTRTLRLPNTGMATTIDIGDTLDIHPKNKQDVGLRLAIWALARDYGLAVDHQGPVATSARLLADGSVSVTFTSAEGLHSRGGPPSSFELVDRQGRAVAAQARVEGASVVVRATGLSDPVEVRYAWASDPAANCFDSSGLPMVPFRLPVSR